MGSSPSSLKRKESHASMSSPSGAFGRMRFDSLRMDSPALVALRRNRQIENDTPFRGGMARSGSTNGISELTPLVHVRDLKYQHDGSQALSSAVESLGELPSPPLGVWIVPALLCALAYAFYNIFIKKGSASIHPVLGGVILQFVAAILGVFLISYIIVRDGGTADLHYDWDGIQWSICAGIAVGLAEMISFFVSSLGVQAMQSIPIIIGGSVMFGTLLGLLLLGELLSMQGWIGVVLLISGICLIGTDPAAMSNLGH
mmetsp:Transcript_12345/g.22412  ORF Transcript_12345/g.22412 Transcript_12345/m.22412 type:complete len:258 (-) Transcript_12345:42-815(-)